MRPVQRHTLLLGSLLLGLSTAYPLQAAPLSDFEQFRSYPYMDRSYREAKKGNWKEVERLMRHLLEKVPKNDEARALLVESLAKQRRYKDAIQALPKDNSEAVLDLRLTWIEQDPPSSTQVEQWMATSDLNDRVRLWQAYSLSLAKFGGAAKAHDWLAQLSPKGDENILRLARANWSEQLRDWSGTIGELAPLAARKQLDAEGWQRLANAYVQRLDEKPLQQLLQQAPDPQAARKVRLAMVDRAIAMGHDQQAQRWLQSLPAADLADPAQRQRLWELARQTDDVPTVQRLSNDLQRPCLETTEWLSRHDPEAALTQLRQCQPSEDPQAWLVLAQRLQATDLLQSTRLPEPWDSRRQAQLVDVWQEQGESSKVMVWLAGQTQTPAVVKRRAELAQRMGRRTEEQTLWEYHYRQTGNLASLNQASFLALQSGDRAHARQLLENAYDRHGARLPPVALQRLAGLYASPTARTTRRNRAMRCGTTSHRQSPASGWRLSRPRPLCDA
jgi:adsorption protein A